jgi:hypothetical protein
MRLKKGLIHLVFLLAVFLSGACAPLSMNEQAQYAELLKESVVSEPIDHKNVWAAGILDFLIPGFGHFYLGEWGSGGGLFLSNIFWPLSPFWATPAAVADTDNVNKRYTIEYYILGPGKETIAKMQKEKCFAKAKEYIVFQMQNGKAEFSRVEITQYLYLQNFTSDQVTSLDFTELQQKTGCQIQVAEVKPVLQNDEKSPLNPES